MRLGIFDSGIGGEAIAKTLRNSFPKAEILVVDDQKNVPYGEKTNQEIIDLTNKAIQPLLKQDCDVIVIACNTATAVAIDTLREKYPHQKFIGIEPMIKTASELTKTNKIAVFATPATLKSKRYKNLINNYGKNLEIIEPNVNHWALMIEKNQINYQSIHDITDEVCSNGADVILISCTHYHWIKDSIIKSTDRRATVIEPSEAISQRVKNLLNLS